MSPESSGALKDAALAAIATFLRSTGLEAPASVVDKARASLSGGGPDATDAVAAELQNLATALVSLSEAATGKRAVPAEAWTDGLLRRVAGRGGQKELDDPALSARLQAALGQPSRRSRVAPSGDAADRGQAVTQQPPAVPIQEKPSAHYVPRQPGLPDPVVYEPNLPEEYRDDLDPGYRIREMNEAELLQEIQEQYERSLVASPTLPWGGSFTDGGSPKAPLFVSQGTAPGFGASEKTVDTAAEAHVDTAAEAQEDELLSAPVDGEAANAAGGMDDELLHSESEKGSLLSGLVKSAGSVMAALGGAVGGGSKNSSKEPCPDQPLFTEAAKPATVDTGPNQDELADSDVPTFGGTFGNSGGGQPSLSQEATAAFQSRASGSDAAQAEMPGYGQVAGDAVTADPLLAGQPTALACRRKERRPGDRPIGKYPESGDSFYPVELDGVVYDSLSLRIVHERDRTGFEETKDFPIRPNSIIAARYQVLEYLGSAAFSRAVQCLDLQTNRMVCMKIIKNNKDFFDQSLDEIKLLRLINANIDNVDDKHCLALIDYFYHKEHLIIVTELLRDNLYEFSKYNREACAEPYFTLGRLQRISKQILIALEYIHRLWLIHADLKPENILIRSYSRCEVKVIDFGSSCFVDDQLTNYVQSRSYRAPEVMLGLAYDQKIDIWSLGCIIAELWTGYVLFQNNSIQSLLARIMGIIGPFPQHMLAAGRFVPQYFTQDGRLYKENELSAPVTAPVPQVDPSRRLHLLLPKRSSLRQRMRTDDEAFLDFLRCLLQVDPAERLTATEALKHPWLSPGRYSDGLQ
eukprot:TRINITY_DN30941_c0_g1_i1.p1 TRINITY_DN30941_c0_g1~~TRINITY_DN30941_c0_g1_i1.p1  ORF type:complete len:832 (+),score=141.63 TRINITY_DN30941_c0_g1_i1:80-2497(+)